MKQGDLFDAWGAAQDGAERAADHADATHPGWSDEALYLLQKFAEHRDGAPFMIEDVRDFAHAQGLAPAPDSRAWGAVALRAKGAGIIVKTGYGSTTRGPAHSHPRSCWALVCRPATPEPELRWPVRQMEAAL